MAEEANDQQDRTEDASPARRQEFREKGQIAVSREITSVFVLAGAVLFLSFYLPLLLSQLQRMFINRFQNVARINMTPETFHQWMISSWLELLSLIVPLCTVTIVVAVFITFSQTKMNWSWKRLTPDFKRMNPLKGLAGMANSQALVNLLKGIGKMAAVGLVSWLILRSEWSLVPGLMRFPVEKAWGYWGEITRNLFWAVSALLLVIGAGDYSYNLFTLEKKMKMTKQEAKEEQKKYEGDPHVKARIKRMQREMVMSKMVKATRDATVLVTNPTHYAVALKYELGMRAPVVVAKGIDFNALRLREVAAEADVPIVENKPLARTLYKIGDVGEEIPAALYQAVSEVVKYVFKLKGIALPGSQRTARADV